MGWLYFGVKGVLRVMGQVFGVRARKDSPCYLLGLGGGGMRFPFLS